MLEHLNTGTGVCKLEAEMKFFIVEKKAEKKYKRTSQLLKVVHSANRTSPEKDFLAIGIHGYRKDKITTRVVSVFGSMKALERFSNIPELSEQFFDFPPEKAILENICGTLGGLHRRDQDESKKTNSRKRRMMKRLKKFGPPDTRSNPEIAAEEAPSNTRIIKYKTKTSKNFKLYFKCHAGICVSRDILVTTYGLASSELSFVPKTPVLSVAL